MIAAVRTSVAARSSSFEAAAADNTAVAMLHFLLLQNRQGRTRLSKYYSPFAHAEKHQLESEVHKLITKRDPKYTNFIEFRKYKIVYRRYAGEEGHRGRD